VTVLATTEHVREARQYRFADRDFRVITRLVHERTGIALSDQKRDLVYGRLSKRLRQLQMESFSDYCQLLEDGDAEFENLINAITTNHTKFFREAHHFVHLKTTVIPDLQKQAKTSGNRKFRMWSAACSSGEEPCSIALTFMAYLASCQEYDVRILATDLDSNVLSKAKAAKYSGEQFDHLPPKLVARLPRTAITVSDNDMTLSEEVRHLIIFKQLNLMSPWPMKEKFDAIMCRNVMIYFDEETKRTLVKRFDKQLKVGGFLYTGHAESLLGLMDNYKMVGRTVYRKME
jgi:chemotaxis protein methyltransferase CheR